MKTQPCLTNAETTSNGTVVLDCETDNLLPFLTKIWCVCVLDTGSGEIRTYTDREEFLEASKDFRQIIGHNVMFDLFALWLVWKIPFTVGPDTFNGRPVTIIDTLVRSRYLNPDRLNADGTTNRNHRLESWGRRINFAKTGWNDFSEYSVEMDAYCQNDVLLTDKVHKELTEEMRH